ncbi:MAG: helix-turn-helix transcriptional regulator [Blautia sp.]|nr:helix-turn-helix transcriptional regulator [Blautia sp.]
MPDTIQRLRSGKAITTQTINTLCSVINCKVADILEYIPDEEN